jgi:hypothetical protein
MQSERKKNIEIESKMFVPERQKYVMRTGWFVEMLMVEDTKRERKLEMIAYVQSGRGVCVVWSLRGEISRNTNEVGRQIGMYVCMHQKRTPSQLISTLIIRTQPIQALSIIINHHN